ncbi:MAG: hypothetical protein ACTHLW_06040 [Verrucomicrobiota bacterium]
MKPYRTCELTRHVSLCSDGGLTVDGAILTPDYASAYGECYLAHAFPVTTVDGTAMLPQVVYNSHRSMLFKVVDLLHMIRAYNPAENKRDRVLGSVIGVDFPKMPEGGWPLETERDRAPGIRAVFVIHRQLEQAEDIIQSQLAGVVQWTVSMENNYDPDTSGFLVQLEGSSGARGIESWQDSTPDFLRERGFVYVPYPEAPGALRDCFDSDATKIIKPYCDQETTFLLGGLNDRVSFKGIGLTPLGKEKEARLSQMLASGVSYVDLEGMLTPRVLVPFRKTLNLWQGSCLALGLPRNHMTFNGSSKKPISCIPPE